MRRFGSFFLGSLAGLVIDVGGFTLLSLAQVPPLLANGLSSSASITVVYALVTRFAFAGSARPSTYAAFFAWYALNIVCTSLFIAGASAAVLPLPLLWKAISIPISFLANYWFSRTVLRPRTLMGTATAPPVAAAQK